MYKPNLKIWSRLDDLVRCILSFNFLLRSSISEIRNVLGTYSSAFVFLLKAQTKIINIVKLESVCADKMTMYSHWTCINIVEIENMFMLE